LSLTSRPTIQAEAYYSVHNYLDWWSVGSWRVPLTNALWIAFGTAHLQAESLLTNVAWLVPVTVGLLTWIRIIRASREASRPLPLMLLGYAAVMLIWTWPPRRFLSPLLPFLSFYTVEAFGQAFNWLHARLRTLLAVGVVAGVLCANTYHIVRTRAVIEETEYPARTYVVSQAPTFAAYYDLFSWIRANTDPRDVIASGLDSMVYLYTDRQAIRPFVVNPGALFYGLPGRPLGDIDDLAGLLVSARVGYVVELPMPEFSEMEPLTQLFSELRRERPGCLREVYQVPADSRFVISRIQANHCTRD
jgi:hypothetical protein